MTERDNPDSKYSENHMEEEEEEDNVRTMNCLRGRLLAERMASRNAREEADTLGKKLLELENQLKEEAKSRNRAEKKLKFLMKKLQSMNISYVRDESQSSVSSTASSRIRESEKSEYLQMNRSQESPKGSQNSKQNDSISEFDVNLAEVGSNGNSISAKVSEIFEKNVEENEMVEDSLPSAGEEHYGKSRNCSDSTTDIEQRVESCQEDDQDPENQMDSSMAIIPVDIPNKNQKIDPEILDVTVKEVLDALKLAKEELQISMERRRMNNIIRVG